MMSVTHPDLCRSVAVRHSLGLVAVCTAAPLLDVTHWAFAVDSLPLNLYMVYLSFRYRGGMEDWFILITCVAGFTRRLTATPAGSCSVTP